MALTKWRLTLSMVLLKDIWRTLRSMCLLSMWTKWSRHAPNPFLTYWSICTMIFSKILPTSATWVQSVPEEQLEILQWLTWDIFAKPTTEQFHLSSITQMNRIRPFLKLKPIQLGWNKGTATAVFQFSENDKGEISAPPVLKAVIPVDYHPVYDNL